MKKKIIFGFIVLVLVAIGLTVTAHGKVKSYYSGDAINFQNSVIVGSTNSDRLEIFRLTDNGLARFVNITAPNNRFGIPENFYDIKFSHEGDNLFAYAISGYSIYKYNISDFHSAQLVAKDTNTYWEWYSRVDKFGDDIVTISAKGVKVWGKNLNLIDSYIITNDIPYNISSGGSDKYIFNIVGDSVQVFDRETRQVVRSINVNYLSATGNRSLYFDSYNDLIYVVDDSSAKKFDLSGNFKDGFDHSGTEGYDISSANNEYVYFTDGIGVVKLDKSNMNPLAWSYTGGISGAEGWAMGLKVVSNIDGDRVIIFNNSSIIVLDQEMQLLGVARAGETNDNPSAAEKLSLVLSSVSGSTGVPVTLSGTGYYPNEKLIINFGTSVYNAQADNYGRFRISLSVPAISSQIYQGATGSPVAPANLPLTIREGVDIKVVGQDSNLSYSTAFEIKNIQN